MSSKRGVCHTACPINNNHRHWTGPSTTSTPSRTAKASSMRQGWGKGRSLCLYGYFVVEAINLPRRRLSCVGPNRVGCCRWRSWAMHRSRYRCGLCDGVINVISWDRWLQSCSVACSSSPPWHRPCGCPPHGRCDSLLAHNHFLQKRLSGCFTTANYLSFSLSFFVFVFFLHTNLFRLFSGFGYPIVRAGHNGCAFMRPDLMWMNSSSWMPFQPFVASGYRPVPQKTISSNLHPWVWLLLFRSFFSPYGHCLDRNHGYIFYLIGINVDRADIPGGTDISYHFKRSW